ncbi:aminoglycoside 6-adenylyltransferase [Jeotgalibacillus aurantiacus]|uniref:aminoglycoside 6-adenylyltransferase n=1 Tax=Jeotgalibacillus aurantiacus TaxID=2763266 RepID=UPI001D0BBFEE|nr:aminoglycoside 6-adenylyltransferase [Jeotgalibacillus aurantiacus]
MVNEQEFFRVLLPFAQKEPAIEGVLLTSSRANPHAFRDEWTDFDIELFVNDFTLFQTDDWLNTFGELAAAVPKMPEKSEEHMTRLTLFQDGTKVDFQILHVSTSKKLNPLPLEYDVGYRILLDKTGVFKNMPHPTHQAYRIQPPTEVEFAETVNSFWWDTSYISKSLRRDELFFAKFISESALRLNFFQPLIEWRIGSKHDWNVNPNKMGRWFKRYLSKEDWEWIERTYAGPDLEDNWRALFHMMDVYHDWATELATELGYPYDLQTEQNMRAYSLKLYHER